MSTTAGDLCQEHVGCWLTAAGRSGRLDLVRHGHGFTDVQIKPDVRFAPYEVLHLAVDDRVTVEPARQLVLDAER